jgi:hypothetical protein
LTGDLCDVVWESSGRDLAYCESDVVWVCTNFEGLGIMEMLGLFGVPASEGRRGGLPRFAGARTNISRRRFMEVHHIIGRERK